MTDKDEGMVDPHAEQRRRLAGLVMARAFAALRLPPTVEGGVDEAADRSAGLVAETLVKALSRAYGIESWDFDTFRRVYIEGAVRGWKPGTTAHETGGGLKVVLPGCPLLEPAKGDFRVCETCQLVHEKVAQLTWGAGFRGVVFHSLSTPGDPECRFTFKMGRKAALLRRARDLI